MKKIVFGVIAILIVAANMKALEPVRIGLNYPNPSGSLTIKLVDVATGNDLDTIQVNNVTANSSGIVSLVVGENDPDWGDLSSSLASDPSIMLRVFDDQGNFIKQFVYRDLVSVQSSTGNGGVLDDGFNSTGGVTTSGETADDFLFGATAIPFSATGGFIAEGDETKFFFKNSKGAIRAGAVTSTVWDDTNLGEYSTGFGYNTTASGQASFAAGNYTTAFGINSTALGDNTEASGEGSFAAGGNTVADGSYSSAFGIGTSAQSLAEFAVGSYNTDNESEGAPRLFVVGNGNDIEGIERSDAFEVFSNGNTRVHTDLEVDEDAYINGTLEVDGLTYPANDGSDGQLLILDSEANELVWSDPTPTLNFDEDSFSGDGTEETPYSINLNTDGTLTGDPFSVEGSLGVDLTAANTWTGNTTFGADLSLTENSFTENGNQALYTDDNGLVTAGSGETVQNAAGIYAGTANWGANAILTISDAAVNTNSIISITYVGADEQYDFRVENIQSGSFDVVSGGQGNPEGAIHYMIINQ